MPDDAAEDAQDLSETAHLMRSSANARRLSDAVERLEAGRGHAHGMVDPDPDRDAEAGQPAPAVGS